MDPFIHPPVIGFLFIHPWIVHSALYSSLSDCSFCSLLFSIRNLGGSSMYIFPCASSDQSLGCHEEQESWMTRAPVRCMVRFAGANGITHGVFVWPANKPLESLSIRQVLSHQGLYQQ
ncbi:hypothetical protein MPTK1_4g15000 [Marchantia polymorpha subsp. ruderalis]|uniref:Uncharacterized protein n=2 Tax=Marchantia polymorpha TaxID=3197 RepID=A0AAF6BA21_MARPO|nr:hypothetical protein MARPO_0119s0023 [Marchantia polymorpha]PTQ30820.1 hypothetical protein MARPO_0119s0023 [Marchantia polymorpha]BBN08854.1 hypothetical protein Mp_4g15000 [Marchantia polymorpha subsp. ruderalis]BBN08855.1 hypothetical protein Mp_4g15000 [Marchantia polymorpha subsp. ruderalis]|eukprot:PTQ30819.1 hypothetical protein MARPO_0119s0023 [Marchantia polymorpha]